MSDDADWAAETERAIEEHDPTREPYASMGRDEIRELMQADGIGAYELEMLNQFFLDKCSRVELERINFTTELAEWLVKRRNTFGNDQAMLCLEVANTAAARLFGDMPPPGPLHEIN
jgi:hypothetical protein